MLSVPEIFQENLFLSYFQLDYIQFQKYLLMVWEKCLDMDSYLNWASGFGILDKTNTRTTRDK